MMVPTLNFSGMMYPTSTLSSQTYLFAHAFPGAWFQLINLGGFTKGLGFADFFNSYGALLIIYLIYISLAAIRLKKQEK